MAAAAKTKVHAKIEALARKAYVPVVSKSRKNQSLIESKFGGKPFLSTPKYAWPVCAGCGKKMAFFLQLNSATLPPQLQMKEEYFDGLLQLFYCTSGECDDLWQPFSAGHALRVVQSADVNANQIEEMPKDVKLFPIKRITDWNEVTDYPSVTELAETVKLTKKEHDVADSFEDELENLGGEKLFGWPRWSQGVEYPSCRKCNKTMRLLLQVDSEHNIPFCFGDLGIAHITQCEEHREELAFGWAC